MFFQKTKKNKPDGIKKSPAQNPRILEVNLIKGEMFIPFDWKRHLAIFLLTILIAGAFIAEVYFGLNLWAKEEMKKSDKLAVEISTLRDDVKKMQEKADSALLYKSKATEVSRLLDQHIYWTNFFSWLESKTLSTVKFSGFNGDTSGVYNLEAITDRYQEVSWQVKALLDDPIVKKASVLEVISSEEDPNEATSQEKDEDILDVEEEPESLSEKKSSGKFVDFSLSLEIDPTIFKK